MDARGGAAGGDTAATNAAGGATDTTSAAGGDTDATGTAGDDAGDDADGSGRSVGIAGARGRKQAFDGLRRAILSGDVGPGQRLVEEELAARFGVTRASLRAALIDLAAEGLVERIPNRGARVRAVSIGEAIAITECRMALEGLCAAKAAERVTGAQATRLREIGDSLARAASDGEPLKYSALNQELHRLVRDISGQDVAAGLLERLHGQLVRHQFQLALRPGRPQASLPEHLAIIDAIVARRPEAAEEAARRHLRSVIAALKESSTETDHEGMTR